VALQFIENGYLIDGELNLWIDDEGVKGFGRAQVSVSGRCRPPCRLAVESKYK
jgi:hypothetical protein